MTRVQHDTACVAGAEKYKPYPAYKDSGVEWLGEIPAHWEVAPVHARYEVALGKMLDEKRIRGESSGPYIRNVDVQWDSVNTQNLPTMDFLPKERKRYGLLPGDLLVCEGGEVGRTATWQGEIEECFFQKAIHRVRTLSEQNIPRFFFYLMRFFAASGVFVAGSNPNTINHLTAIQLRHYQALFPPRSEQVAVSAHLDRETAKIDALVAKKERLIRLLEEKRSALISRAVTKGLDSDVPMKDTGAKWLGEIPVHWEVLTLRRRWEIIDCKHVTVPFADQGIPLASVRETQSFKLNLSNARYTTCEWYAILVEGKRRPRRGDLVYCRNVSVGSAAFVDTDERFAMGQDVCIIRSAWENQRWLNYYLHSNTMSNQLATILVGSTFDRINVSEIRELITPVPPRQEQDDIAAFLDCESARIDALVVKVREAVDRLRELRTALISAAVTGKIDVRETAA